MVRMKYLSRNYFWRPNLDKGIEFKVWSGYESKSLMPTIAPLQAWEIPNYLYQQIQTVLCDC